MVTLTAFVASTATPFVAAAQAVQSMTALPPSRLAAATDAPTAAPPSAAEPGIVDLRAADYEKMRRTLERVYGQPVYEPSLDAAEVEPPAAPRNAGVLPSSKVGRETQAPTTQDKSVGPTASGLRAEGLPTASTAVVTGKTISVPTGEATIKGMDESFSAQLSTGIATYSVPFALPAARGAAQPSLGLSYSSAGGFGVAGVGWSVGVAFIARQTDRGTPRYNDSSGFDADQDRFVFNGGQELVPICVAGPGCAVLSPPVVQTAEQLPAWATGWQYFRPRVEGAFLRFFLSPDHRTWRVEAKSGVTMELGVPLDGSGSRNAIEENPAPSGTPEIFRWLLAREYDTYGADIAGPNPAPVNVVRYGYDNFGGTTAYLSDIYDTPPAQNAAVASLAAYAHHTRLRYEDRPDPTRSYRSGWRIEDGKRLVGVDVTSKPCSSSAGCNSTAAPRELIRRYHLAYDPGFHASLLTSVTVEGRCGDSASAQIAEDGSEGLPRTTGCPALPPMAFSYSHVAGHLSNGLVQSPPIAGYEPFDERLSTVANSPPYSLDDAQTVLHDVNGDGLPDVLVTAPGFFGGKDGIYFNGAGGVAAKFVASTIGVHGVGGDNSGTLTLGNANVVRLDIDGDGAVDLVHMPLVKTYSVYTAQYSSGAWWWEGRPVTTADSLSPKIDFGRDASFTKVVDVNFDGLVDVVRSTGTRLETYLSLGRYPQGDGRFGHAVRTGPDTATLFTDPVTACLPWSGTAVSLGDKDTQLADMNGDGIVDIVRLRRGDIRYWPGRGNGFWGTGARDDCPGDTFGQGRDVQMTDPPYYSDIQGDSLRLDDVNGDGLPDLVQIRFQDTDIWLNADGEGWTKGHTIHGTPASPSYANRVQLTDINGSGTPDILWGDSGNYQYLDLQGGVRPWLLMHVENGLGKTTDLSYSTSVAEMLSDKPDPQTPRNMPIVSQVVKRVTVSDNLTVAGRPPSSDVTEYTYAEPVYDGRQREFRGFRRATSRRVGDANSPAETTASTFLLGECADETPSNGADDCSVPERWRDNPREALKGLAYVTERRNEVGAYLSTVNTTYHLRDLYKGLDGRHVRHAFAEADSTALYDVALPAGGGTSSTTIVTLESPLGAASTPAVSDGIPRRSTAGAATLSHSFVVDAYGNSVSRVDSGCTGGTPCTEFTEEAYTYTQTPQLIGDWIWRVSGESVKGAAHAQAYNVTSHTFDAHGQVLVDNVALMGTVDLVRNQTDTAYFPPRSLGTGAQPVSTTLQTYDYDPAFGSLIHQSGANLRCRDVAYDSAYRQLPVSETLYAGGCGTGALTTTVDAYDRGLGVPTLVHDASGQPTRVDYDGFGRVVKLFKPDPAVQGGLSARPSVTAEYFLPDAGTPGYSRIHTSTQDGADPSSSSYLESWSYVDGFGRTFVTLKEAEGATPGGPGQWIVAGLTDYDDKSAVRAKFLDHFTTDAGGAYGFAGDVASPSARQSYDAFGRPLVTADYDGTPTLTNVYHALSVDRYDAEDRLGTTHLGTFLTELSDGHGRVAKVTERIGTDQRITRTQFLPTGAPEVIRRTQASTGAEISRYLVYDTRGRLVVNVEPNTSPTYLLNPAPNATATNQTTYPSSLKAWRYRYDDAGDLVGVSDARGCGANFFFDGLGRLTMEDYFPCDTASQAVYSPPILSGGQIVSGVEVAYEYDAISAGLPVPATITTPAAWLRGHLTRVMDQASYSVFAYDGRGRKTSTALRIAKPGTVPIDFPSRYAPRVYQRSSSFDAADRPLEESTGAAVPELMGAGSTSIVRTAYNARGAVQAVDSSYGLLVTNVTRTADGLVSDINYGDAAHTATAFTYEDFRRRLETVMTYRSPLGGWPASALTTGTTQMTLEFQLFMYDLVSNPIRIADLRDPSEWPTGSKPVNRAITYDDFYRATNVQYSYASTGGTDAWVSPFANELAAYSANPSDPQSQIDPRRAMPSPQITFAQRMNQQSFTYDWSGNTSSSTDDAQGFYDRSLGTIQNATGGAGPYQLTTASIAGNAPRGGSLKAEYDAAGNMVGLYVSRNGPCQPASVGCGQVFRYAWDELGRLSRARRWDSTAVDPNSPPSASLLTAADLTFKYDADDDRVVKSATDATGRQRHTLYVFDTLDIRRADYSTTTADYQLDSTTEVPYLFANGVRLARVVYQPSAGAPQSAASNQHVFFELGDHLGSTTVVLDQATGELVEASSYQAYGAAEADYRPDRWNDFREDYRFTGKEEDVEVGLVYFGKRYLSPALNRWVSPDPLALHDAGNAEADLNLYAYVSGRAFVDTDPEGLAVPNNSNDQVVQAAADDYQKRASEEWKKGNESKSFLDAAGHYEQAYLEKAGELLTRFGPTAVGFASMFLGVGTGKSPPSVEAPGVPAVESPAAPAAPAAEGRTPSVTGPGAPDATVATPQAKAGALARPGLPDNALVCRGGTCTAEHFEKGTGVTVGPDGKLQGVSAQSKPGASVGELAKPFKNGQVGVTTAGKIRQAGGTVSPDGTPKNPNHATVSGITAKQAEKLLSPPQPNPVPKNQRGL